MNCKPGDLAEIIGSGPDTFNLIGTRVVVTELHPVEYRLRRFESPIPCWYYVAMDGQRLRSLTGRQIAILEDCYLKPVPPEEQGEGVRAGEGVAA